MCHDVRRTRGEESASTAFGGHQKGVEWLVDEADLQVSDGPGSPMNDVLVGHQAQHDSLWVRFRGRCHVT